MDAVGVGWSRVFGEDPCRPPLLPARSTMDVIMVVFVAFVAGFCIGFGLPRIP